MIGTTKVKPHCPQGDVFKPPIPANMKESPEGFFSAFSYLWNQEQGKAMARICLKLPTLCLQTEFSDSIGGYLGFKFQILEDVTTPRSEYIKKGIKCIEFCNTTYRRLKLWNDFR